MGASDSETTYVANCLRSLSVRGWSSSPSTFDTSGLLSNSSSIVTRSALSAAFAAFRASSSASSVGNDSRRASAADA